MSPIHKVIIVDDEPPARAILKAYLKKFSEFEVVTECANGFEALKAIKEYQPDVLFLDIQMPKVTGLELLDVIDDPVNVVFTTAYDQYAIKAFELNAIDYLLKPFSEERFADAINKLKIKLTNGTKDVISVQTIQEEIPEKLDRVVVKKGSQLKVLRLDDILYFEAQSDYVMVHTKEERFLKSNTMAWFEKQLPEQQFVRIHRSYIVNSDKIEKLEPYDKDTHLAVLSQEVKLKISRTGYKKLKEVLRF